MSATDTAALGAELTTFFTVRNFIGGELRPATTGTTLALVDPGTGQEIGTVADSGAADVAAAVHSAREAFDGGWSDSEPEERQRILLRLADLIERDIDILAQLEAVDTGKPLAEARLDIEEAATVVRYFAGWADKADGAVIPAPRQYFATASREALGVCAAITPWNYPLPILTYKIAPALAFGNTVVAKPSELASVTSVVLAQLATEAGIPDGVFNVVVGGREAGAALSAAAGIDKIAFTGSTPTGQSVLRAAAERLIPATVELGGKSAQVVFADADLDAAVDGIANGIWLHAGQICVAGSRVLVEARVADQLLQRLIERANSLVPGHALNGSSTLGPVVSEAQRAKIHDVVREAEYTGAAVYEATTDLPTEGFFVAPTIITNVADHHRAVQEEIFGPVLVVQTFHDEDEAIRRANGTRYGLAAGVWTENGSRALRVSRGLTAGSVWVNTYGVFHPTLPFGGTKASGFGRELGSAAVEHYTRTKTTVVEVVP